MELLEGDAQFFPGVHHDRSVPGDRLTEGPARDEEEPQGLPPRHHPALVAVLEEAEAPVRDRGAPLLLAAGAPGAVEAGFDAGALIKAISPAVKGGGGGKPDMAQAGGKDAAGIDEALRIAREKLGIG